MVYQFIRITFTSRELNGLEYKVVTKTTLVISFRMEMVSCFRKLFSKQRQETASKVKGIVIQNSLGTAQNKIVESNTSVTSPLLNICLKPPTFLSMPFFTCLLVIFRVAENATRIYLNVKVYVQHLTIFKECNCKCAQIYL